MPQLAHVSIIGVGLIGGSIGLALRERNLAGRVTGIGRRSTSLRKARACGAIDTATTSIGRGVRSADLVIVCTPVGLIVDHVTAAAADAGAGTVITDAGSTKVSIVDQLDKTLPKGSAFVGSHPMAGSEQTGVGSARPDLFEDRWVIITPTAHSTQASLECIESFWQALGARTIRQTAAQHDRAVAAISHMPHVVAAALAGVTSPSDRKVAAKGWLDTTRIAAGDVDLWCQIIYSNRDNILKSLDKLDGSLARFRQAIATGNEAALRKLLQNGKDRRDSVGN